MLGESYRLTEIAENGDCKIASIGFKGDVAQKTIDIACETMYAKYAPAKVELPTNAKYPENSATGNEEWKADQFAKNIGVALGTVVCHYGNANVVARESPNRTVFSLQEYKKGELVLVPATTKIKIIDLLKSKDVAADPCLFTCGGDVPDGYAFHLKPTPSDIVAPAFFMQSSDDAKVVNMKVMMVRIDIATKVATKGAVATSSNVAIPVLINTKGLKEGDELHNLKPAKNDESKSKKRPFDVI